LGSEPQPVLNLQRRGAEKKREIAQKPIQFDTCACFWPTKKLAVASSAFSFFSLCVLCVEGVDLSGPPYWN